MSSEGSGSAVETAADGDPDVGEEGGDRSVGDDDDNVADEGVGTEDDDVADEDSGGDIADDTPPTRGRDLLGAPADADGTQSSTTTATESTDRADNVAEEFGRRGWLLVAAVVVSTLFIPSLVYLYPTVLADRVPFLVAMLVLPFLPAVLLGLLAVWSITASSRASQGTDEGE